MPRVSFVFEADRFFYVAMTEACVAEGYGARFFVVVCDSFRMDERRFAFASFAFFAYLACLACLALLAVIEPQLGSFVPSMRSGQQTYLLHRPESSIVRFYLFPSLLPPPILDALLLFCILW